ncbi:hypothetical protein F5Y01DRAFT_286926 [Xylaria sp. FL0043]|nr:hypothetical protein F5Y01DRAFT_286926 [Xylaria sp. FL0043]
MFPPVSLSQASLATAIGLSAAGIWAGTTPPNPSPDKEPATGDSIRWTVTLQQKYGNVMYLALGAAACRHIAMVCTYPNVPSWLLRHASANGLNPGLFTWSKDTAIPLALILAGASLRLLSYGALGRNFTFGLQEPDKLNTTGLYRYIQHPSYSGLLAIAAGIMGLWGRADGIVSCLLPPAWYASLRQVEPVLQSIVFASIISVISRRVKDEEEMLHGQFGKQWEDWHSRTARFVPFLF